MENVRIESQSQSTLATNKVLRNTYALLGLSLIPTTIGAYIGMSMNFFICSTTSYYVCHYADGWYVWFIFCDSSKS